MVKYQKEVYNPFELQRKERMEWLTNYLSKLMGNNEEIITMKIVAMLETKFGMSEKTAREYLRAIMFSLDLQNIEGKLVKKKA